MDASANVKQGIWTDYSRDWLNTSKGLTTFVQLILGVLLGAATPRLGIIFIRTWRWLLYGYYWLSRRLQWTPGTQQDPEERRPLLVDDGEHDAAQGGADNSNSQTPDPAHPEQQPQPAANVSTNEMAIPGDNDNALTENPKELSISTIPWTVSLIAIIVSVGWAVASSFATQMPADSLGLLASRSCGSWQLMKGVGESVKADDALLRSEQERRAGEYARACYGSRSVSTPDQCTFFSTQSINYTITTNVPCPFKQKSICAGGGVPIAARFETGLVDAQKIGINAPSTPKFNRTSICVPLNLDHRGFIKNIPPDENHYDWRYEYHLGERNHSDFYSNYTLRTSGDPFKTELPAYSLSVYESTPYRPDNDYWRPISELLEIDDPDNAYLTIMFISSCLIIYRGPSKDEVFPATEEYPPGSGRFRNGDPRARLLACIDWNNICTHDDKCFSVEVEHNCEGKEESSYAKDGRVCSPEYEYTRATLRESTIYKAIHLRLGDALVAQEKIADYESYRLDDEQWIIESKRLFNTSLARIQYDTLDIAVGAGHEKDSYEEVTPKWARGKLCNRYKFQLPPDYANIDVWPTFFLFLIPPAILILSLQTPWTWPFSFNDEKKDHFKGNWLVFDKLIWAILTTLYYLVWYPGKWCSDHAQERIVQWKNRRQNQTQSAILPAHASGQTTS